jgi:anti-sigma factor RsiW
MTSAADLFSADEASEAFLDRLPDNFRGAFKNMALLSGPRVGVTSPEQIAAAVRAVYARRSDAGAVAVVAAMDDYPDELRQFLVSILDHDRQPEEVRRARKALGREQGVRRWMQGRPVSPNQGYFLRERLGYSGPAPSSMAEASALIERLQKGGRGCC